MLLVRDALRERRPRAAGPGRRGARRRHRPRLVLPEPGRAPRGLRPLGGRQREERAPRPRRGDRARSSGRHPPHPGLLPRMAAGRLRLLLHPLPGSGRRWPPERRTTTGASSSTSWDATGAQDPLVFEAREPEDWPSVHLSPDGRWLAVSVSKGWTRTDVYLRDLSATPGFATVVEGEEALHGVLLRNERLYLLTNWRRSAVPADGGGSSPSRSRPRGRASARSRRT